MPLNLKSSGGGGVLLNPASTGVDITLTLPATNGTLATNESLSSSGTAALVGFTPTGGITATNVQGAIAEIGADLAASSGSSLVGYLPDGTGAVVTTVQSKLRESVSVKDFGAVLDGTTDNTSKVQLAMNSLAATGGYVIIPKKCKYTPSSLTWVNYVVLIDQYFVDGYKVTLNNGTVGGAVNEFLIDSGFHPAYVVDVYNNRTLGTLGGGQVYSNRASFCYRVNGNAIWQLSNDIQANGTNDYTIYRNSPTSFQCMTFTTDSKVIYGQLASGQLFTADYAHNFRGSATSFENSSGNVSIILRKKDDTKRKIITLDTTADELQVLNTANTEYIFYLTNLGHGIFKRGVSGGAFTTTNRNALSVAAGDIGLTVFDSTLGKPVWLKNNTGPVWVDATGTTV